MPRSLPPPRYQPMSQVISTKLTQNAYNRVTLYARQHGLSNAEIFRSLIKAGWAYLHDDQDCDMPLGVDVRLQELPAEEPVLQEAG
jgi:hypothetical protein